MFRTSQAFAIGLPVLLTLLILALNGDRFAVSFGTEGLQEKEDSSRSGPSFFGFFPNNTNVWTGLRLDF
ncbi:MAG: hypothetical protein O7H41_01785 [Planctomycetota bacterium]|nr:hypothetical protein [Planctomycetota bacterium]